MTTIREYRPAAHYDWHTDAHDYARATRLVGPDEEMRMECKCGKRSRWTSLYRDILRAQDRHAKETARSAR